MSNELASSTGFNLDNFITGLETLDSSDVIESKFPYAKLLQPISEAVASSKGKISPGSFLIKTEIDGVETEFNLNTLNIVILNITKPRTMWSDGGFKKGEKPVCRSFDGVTKYAEGIGASTCAACEFSQFKNGQPSRCKPSYEFLCYEVKNGFYFKLQASGASVSIARKFIKGTQSAWRKIQKSISENENKEYSTNHPLLKLNMGPIFAFEIEVESEYRSDDKGSYYVLKFLEPKANPEIFDIADIEVQFAKLNEYSNAARDAQTLYQTMNMLPSSDSLDINPGDDDELPF